jgi:hypothetical protein
MTICGRTVPCPSPDGGKRHRFIRLNPFDGHAIQKQFVTCWPLGRLIERSIIGSRKKDHHMTDTNTGPPADADVQAVDQLHKKYQQITERMEGVIVGQQEVIEQLVVALLCRGHCILEGVPGLAKTLMVSTLASLLNQTFRRIQFTPDLMPADITGTDILEEDRTTGKRVFRFVKGPLFGNMILADEINRTPPKTQSALWKPPRNAS